MVSVNPQATDALGNPILDAAGNPVQTSYVLGDPFMAKYPATFFGKGLIATSETRGVPATAGNALGQFGGPEDDVCFYGTVPVSFTPLL